MQEQLLDWFRSFAPAPLNARAQEWLRVAIGIAFGMSLCVSLGYISRDALERIANELGISSYADYLRRVLHEEHLH
jgi:CBS-domain-containing membrane protein